MLFRSKNYYRNEGKPISQIITIPQMAQAVMAIMLFRPDNARARPSSLLKKEDDYNQLFNHHNPINLYRVCAELVKKVELFLSNNTDNLTASNKNDLKFYVSMVVCQEALSLFNPTVVQIAGLTVSNISYSHLNYAYQLVKNEYTLLGGTDRVAKGTELLEKINCCLLQKYNRNRE